MFTTPPPAILFNLGPLAVHYYGLLVVAGFVLGLVVVVSLFKKNNWQVDEAYNLFFYCIVFGLVGARLYYVAYAWDYYSAQPVDIVKIWQGGLAIHGAIIAAVVTIYFYAKKRKLNLWQLTDIVATAVPLSMALGRWGNYFNQELFGTPTSLPWGIPIELAHRPEQYLNFSFFHPTFLYESLLDLGLFVILWQVQARQIKLGEKAKFGTTTLLFLFGYSLIRFLLEFWRTDFSPEFLGVRWAQGLSAVIMAAVLIVLAVKKLKNKRT
jgi:phosphatidylglycerol:prolipoprotein diacylglycerol transferase